MQLTAIIEREDDGYVALCPQLDIASQGESVAEARENLTEALELFFETAERSEVERRLHIGVEDDLQRTLRSLRDACISSLTSSKVSPSRLPRSACR